MIISDIAAIVTGEHMFAKNTSSRARPSRDDIARLAYQLYEARGRQEGQELDDWLSAERQLTNRHRNN
jgi:hypothetical protein